MPKNRVPTGEGSDGSENCVPSWEMPEGVVGRSEAVVSTTAVAGAAAPANLAGIDVPAIAEVYSSAVDAERVPLVIQASEWRRTVVGAGPVWPVGETGDLMDDMTVPEPLEHSVVGVPNEVGNSYVDIVTVSEPMLNSRDWEDGRQDRMCDDDTLLDFRTEDQRLSPEEEEAIVVGAVGSAAPWFLTGWADEVEIEFMIDTGCQVTILAASVFECMCASNPQVRAQLRPCGRWLVSADSSPLSV